MVTDTFVRNVIVAPLAPALCLAERDHVQDPDGRFRINNFFCHADSWRSALPRLVEDVTPS
jgi:hypothetical protein